MMMDIGLVVFGGLSWAMATFLVAAGLTLIFGILHILNFAHGGFFMVGAYLAWAMIEALGGGVSIWTYIAVALVSGAVVGALGVLVDVTIFRRLRDVEDAYALIATYALLMVCIGAIELIWGLDFRAIMPPEALNSALFIGDLIAPTFTIFIIVCGVVVYVALEVFMARTETGKLVRIVAHDAWMARLLGLDVTRIYLITVVISFALAGLAGGLLVANQGLSPELGGVFLLQAFGVVIVGGMGSIRGAFLAALLLGQIESIGGMLFPNYPGIFYLVALAGLLLIRPQGLLTKGRTEWV
ncbi:amino acid/amide ABC transporter membrane protein 1, HAAT family [Salinihabitans flavidus]|uniref:Amino acid/amide ABC transporter membrane protein 1, HAAT family n=1 Tax=Salinihabitans flavidus TaxID=569882 RepID=A0A1H8RKU7_9RHOB|nr:branched-chain amino acid ABC transporter permease [Salinihabitans flavidus]SEO67179.1 amino acid/amide ABC transporter membrane protein 1, HAAT family [Salinihabitans flavidus]